MFGKLGNKRLTIFGMEFALSTLILGLLTMGIASAAILEYYGRISGTVTVQQSVTFSDGQTEKTYEGTVTAGDSYTDLVEIKNNANVPASAKFVTTQCIKGSDDCNTEGHKEDGITTSYWMGTSEISIDNGLLHLSFDVQEQDESFLLVFIDTREGGTIYDYGDTGSDIRADYMIVDPAAGAFPDWYLGKWLRQEEDGYEGWSQPYDDIRTWNCEGFVAEESRTDGHTQYDFTIPVSCIEYSDKLNLLLQTGAGFDKNWINQEYIFSIPLLINVKKISEGESFTIEPGETLTFAIVNEFDVALEGTTYTITTEVQPTS